jgi:hypothetical protein
MNLGARYPLVVMNNSDRFYIGLCRGDVQLVTGAYEHISQFTWFDIIYIMRNKNKEVSEAWCMD